MWLIHMCDVTHSYMWCVVFICTTWLNYMCDETYSYVWRHAYEWVSSHTTHEPVSMCDMTHEPVNMTYSYVWHDSRTREWMNMTYSYVWRHAFICVTWLIHMCAATHEPVNMCDITRCLPHSRKFHNAATPSHDTHKMSHEHNTYKRSHELSHEIFTSLHFKGVTNWVTNWVTTCLPHLWRCHNAATPIHDTH